MLILITRTSLSFIHRQHFFQFNLSVLAFCTRIATLQFCLLYYAVMFQERASQISPFPEDFSFTSPVQSDPTVEQVYELLQRIFQGLLHEAARSISCVPDNPEYQSEQGEAIYQQLTSNYKEGVLEACQEFVRLNLFDYENSPFCRLSVCSIHDFLDGSDAEEQYILTMLEALHSVEGDTFVKEGLASMISETYMKEYGRNETHRMIGKDPSLAISTILNPRPL